MCLCLSISETLVGTLAETSDKGFVAEDDALEWTEAEDPIIWLLLFGATSTPEPLD
jgi:hypothetical protein